MPTFGELYFSNQYFLDAALELDLKGVAFASTFDVTIYNATGKAVTGPLTVPLEDDTFEVTWLNQVALSNAAELAANDLTIKAHDAITITVKFLEPGRASSQSVVLRYQGASLSVLFQRNLVIKEKPQNQVSETIRFKTDVSEAWDGTEIRARLRANPRTKFEYEYLLPASDSAGKSTLQSRLLGMPSHKAKVILWHRPNLAVSAAYQAGNTPPEISLQIPEAQRDGSIQALKVGEILTIVNANNDLQFVEMTRDATSNASIIYVNYTDVAGASIPLFGQFPVALMPTALCHLREDPFVSVYPNETLSYETVWEGQLDQYPGNNLDSSTLYSDLAPDSPSFDPTRPILREGNLIEKTLDISSNSQAIIFDRKIGVIESFHRRDSSILNFERRFDYSYEPDKVRALFRFLMWTQGRQRSFWVPSGFSNLVPLSHNNAARTLVLEGNELGGLTPLLDGYSSFEATWPNGSKTQHQVTGSVTNADGTVTLTYTQSLSIADVTTLQSIELLFHVRLSSDDIRLTYDGTDSVRCNFDVQTVKQ